MKIDYNMKITINESDVKSLVMESVKRILSELNVSVLRTIHLGNGETIKVLRDGSGCCSVICGGKNYTIGDELSAMNWADNLANQNGGAVNEAIINGRYFDDDDPAFQFDSDDFIKAYRQTESMYLATDDDLEQFYSNLLGEWMDENNAELKSGYKNFEDYCTTIISDVLNDKYSEYEALKKYR